MNRDGVKPDAQIDPTDARLPPTRIAVIRGP